MHPRNIYKDPPNFKHLASNYEEFRKYVTLDISGKIKFNFHDPEALSVLTKTLLLKDFNLNVEIPPNKLVPTLTLRLNYVLWIEDILNSIRKDNSTVIGIDIGTGASSIYSLLCAKKGWRMIATEVDATSYEVAERNIKNNHLSDLITLKRAVSAESILKGVIDENISYNFCMCNPPFFSPSEKPIARNDKRAPPNNAPTGSPVELETKGGEIEFVSKIIEDSSILKDKIIIYTSMIGKHYNLKVLKKKLKEYSPKSIVTTEFQQGRTTRWGLGWSFCSNLPGYSEGCLKRKVKNKSNLPISYIVPYEIDLQDAIHKCQHLFSELKLEVKETKKLPYTCHVIAKENTWSNQRRKRREMMRSNIDEPPTKKLKNDIIETQPLILEFNLQIQKIEKRVELKALWVRGDAGKDGVHQVIQYLKNNFSITTNYNKTGHDCLLVCVCVPECQLSVDSSSG